MVRPWFTKHPSLKRAAIGLALFLVCLIAAIVANEQDERLRRTAIKYTGQFSEAVSQYGPDSPAVAELVRRAAETPVPRDVVALLEPATGRALVAWPSVHQGKRPEEMVLAGGAKLPTIAALLRRPDLTIPRHAPVAVPAGYHASAAHVEAVPLVPGEILLVVTPKPAPTALFWVSVVLGGSALACFLIYWITVAWWVFDDARRRDQNALAWGALALMTNLVGAAVYVVVRPNAQTCHSCRAALDPTFVFCPFCGDRQYPTCPTCDRPLQPAWQYCPACGTTLERD